MDKPTFSLGTFLYNLTSPTPAVHKMLRNWALFIAGIAASIVGIDKAVAHLIPELYVNICKALTVICATSAVHSQAQAVPEPSKDNATPPTTNDTSTAG